MKIKNLNEREKEIRDKAKKIIEEVSNNSLKRIESNDKDYVFISFILNNLPRGLIGLLIAVILSAAMSSTASELNALATTTTIDLYNRNKKNKSSEIEYSTVIRSQQLGLKSVTDEDERETIRDNLENRVKKELPKYEDLVCRIVRVTFKDGTNQKF